MDDMVGRGGFEVPSDEMMDLPGPKCTVVTQAHNLFGFGIILVRCEASGHEYSMVRASGVQRYSHLAPQHLRDAVERLAGAPAEVELARN